MNHITLDFESILTKMAKERGLTISNVTGTLEFKGANMTCVKVTFDIYGTWLDKTIECLNELTFEDDAKKMFESYFHVPESLYRDIALAHMDGRDFDECHDGVHVFAEAGEFEELSTDRHIAGEGCEDIHNDFDECVLRMVYDRLVAEQEAADAARFETELQLRRTA
jgi:hypothetical protein